jgi:hypothetical protein
LLKLAAKTGLGASHYNRKARTVYFINQANFAVVSQIEANPLSFGHFRLKPAVFGRFGTKYRCAATSDGRKLSAPVFDIPSGTKKESLEVRRFHAPVQSRTSTPAGGLNASLRAAVLEFRHRQLPLKTPLHIRQGEDSTPNASRFEIWPKADPMHSRILRLPFCCR